MELKRTPLIVGLALMTFATACQETDVFDNPNNKNSMLNQTDMDFLNRATYTNLGEVEAGNIAMQRGTNAAVTNYGSMMVNDHTMAQNELAAIAQNKNQPLPAETDQEHKNMAAMLMSLSGRAFDSTYMYMMVEGHDKAIALFQGEVNGGQDATVKSYASNKLPALHHHRHMADSIARALFPR